MLLQILHHWSKKESNVTGATEGNEQRGRQIFFKKRINSAEEELIHKTPLCTDNVNLFYNYHNTERENSGGLSLKVLKFISLNYCSLRSQAKRDIFNAIIYEQKPDIIL